MEDLFPSKFFDKNTTKGKVYITDGLDKRTSPYTDSFVTKNRGKS